MNGFPARLFGILMLLALLGGMMHYDTDCCSDDSSCTPACGCQACAIAIITTPSSLECTENSERFQAVTPVLPRFLLGSTIFRPPIA